MVARKAGAAHWRPALFGSLRGWTPAQAGGDMLAGVTLAAITIPEQMATAKLGGFPPQIGFYAFIGATVGFAAFGASRVLTPGADSTITPIFAGTLAMLAAAGAGSAGGMDHAAALEAAAVALALLVGGLLLLAGLLKLGWIAHLLSTPVITGFFAGIAVHIVVSQLPSLFGITKGAGALGPQVIAIVRGLPAANPFSIAIGLGVFALMLVTERISARIPGALIGLVAAVLLVLVFDLERRGVAVLGALPGGLPHPTVPALADLRALLPVALIVAIVVMMQAATVVHSFAAADAAAAGEPGREPDLNRDFVGLGAGNLFAALLGAFPVNASPPRTAVVVQSGARSQFAALVAAALVLVVVLWGRGLLAHVPEAALAGVLLFVAQRIVHVDIISRLLRQAPREGVLVACTAAAVIVLPIETGMAIGIGLSLLHGVWMTLHTRPVELLKLPGTTVWWPPAPGEAGEREARVAVIAFQAPLLFANAQAFKRSVIDVIAARDDTRVVVLEASGIADIDFTAAHALADLVAHCRNANVHFAIARLESVRAQGAVERFGVLAAIGPENLFHSVDEAVRALAPRA